MIETLVSLQANDKILLNAINRDLTRILIDEDKKCNRFKDYPWSPTLNRAYLEHCYWTFRLSKIKTKRSYASVYKKIKTRLPNFDINLQPPDTVSQKQHQARQSIRQI